MCKWCTHLLSGTKRIVCAHTETSRRHALTHHPVQVDGGGACVRMGFQVGHQRARACAPASGVRESLCARGLEVAHARLGPVVAIGFKAADLDRACAAAKG